MASYPENWDEISDSVRKRDGYKCVICGREGDILHVHHVRPRSEGGSDARACMYPRERGV